MIGQVGRYLDTIRAVRPEFDTVIIADAFRSIAVVQVACAIAFVISGLIRIPRFFKREV